MWYIRKYCELELHELEQIFQLRQSIFLIEQESFFKDIDGKDAEAIHLFRKIDDRIVAYSRIINFSDKVTLARVTVNINHRGNGAGRNLVEKGLSVIEDMFPGKDIHIIAMSYLREFYTSFGFETVSDVYIMDNHEHEDMILYRS